MDGINQWPIVKLNCWITNASAELEWINSQAVSITQSKREKYACYFLHPRSAWFDYLIHEFKGKYFSIFLIRIVSFIAYLIGLNRTVYVGNQPVSTSIWSKSDQTQIPLLCDKLSKDYSKYFIGVRNILPYCHSDLVENLKKIGFYAIPSRVIYEFDLTHSEHKIQSHLKRDLSYQKKSVLDTRILQQLTTEQLSRIHYLYSEIYIKKHSPLNAQYTLTFFKDMLDSGVMSCLVLQDANEFIHAFALLYQQDQTLVVPALGYENESDRNGLYRILFATIYNHTKNHRLYLNYSSGAGEFKRNRGGVARLEYLYLKAPSKSRFRKFILSRLSQELGKITLHQLIERGA